MLVVARTRQENDRLIIESITGEFPGSETPESTNAALNFLLISHAMREIAPTPLPEELETTPDKAGHWAFSLYGDFVHYGVFDKTFLATARSRLRTLSLLHIAAARDDVEDIERLYASTKSLDYLAGDGNSPLHWSLAAETSSATKKLLELGANPNVRSDEGATPLMSAVQENDAERALLLTPATT